ncbi:spore coat protein U domain-containing protein, partial [Streptococcus suis]
TNIDVRCTYETPYTLDLDNGKNFDGGTRRMKNGDNFLAYQLFNKTASGESSSWSKLSGIGNTVNTVNKHTVEGQLTTPTAIAPAAGS